MKKINIGELINAKYARSEVIEWLATTLGEITFNLTTAANKGDMSTVGICIAQLSVCTSTAKELNEKVNGKKPGTVL